MEFTPLIAAVECGDQARVKRLVSDGADLADTDAIGWTALHHAAQTGSLETLRLLVTAGAPINAKNDSGRTPLAIAGFFAHLPAASLLADAGAGGLPPVHRAALVGTAADVKVAIAANHNAGLADSNSWTALHYAALRPDPAIASAIMHSGVPADARADDGRTPIHLVAYAGRDEVLTVLLQNAMRPGIRDWIESTPLHYAADSGHADAARILLAAGAPVDALNGGDTPLIAACRRAQTEVVSVLLANKASVVSVDGRPLYPLHELSRPYQGKPPETAYLPLVPLLVRHGADPAKPDYKGLTAIQRAEAAGLRRLAAQLREPRPEHR